MNRAARKVEGGGQIKTKQCINEEMVLKGDVKLGLVVVTGKFAYHYERTDLPSAVLVSEALHLNGIL